MLLLPPDITRMHSGAGRLTEILYDLLADEAEVHLIPTLGQHVPHTAEQNRQMFGEVPLERIHALDWRDGCVEIGQIAADFASAVSDGAADWHVPIGLNRQFIEGPWDLIIHVGHVVPHEVLGFANHNKNYFIRLGSKALICASHMMAACCGIEENLGCLVTPVRQVFDKAEADFLGQLPDCYVQLVLARSESGELVHTGVYVGDDRDTYLAAARQSREENITLLDRPLRKIVCVMQSDEFFSTWVANKAIYRTRMALADGGQLVIIAPGLRRFGEQPEVDALIRKYGYAGTDNVMTMYRSGRDEHADLRDLAHATAHLIHGSSEGRFNITYAPGDLRAEEIQQVGYEHAPIDKMIARYQVEHLPHGRHRLSDGEEFYTQVPRRNHGLASAASLCFSRNRKGQITFAFAAAEILNAEC